MATQKSNGKDAKKEEPKKPVAKKADKETKPDAGNTTVTPSSTGGYIVTTTTESGGYKQSIEETNPLESTEENED
jgi:hypothetical protein